MAPHKVSEDSFSSSFDSCLLYLRSDIKELMKGRAPALRQSASYSSVGSDMSILSQLSAFVDHLYPLDSPCLDSLAMNEHEAHEKRRVSFSQKISVYLIPSIRDQRRDGCDLHWSIDELLKFREDARYEIQAAAIHYACDPVEAFRILYKPSIDDEVAIEIQEPRASTSAVVSAWASFASKSSADKKHSALVRPPVSHLSPPKAPTVLND